MVAIEPDIKGFAGSIKLDGSKDEKLVCGQVERCAIMLSAMVQCDSAGYLHVQVGDMALEDFHVQGFDCVHDGGRWLVCGKSDSCKICSCRGQQQMLSEIVKLPMRQVRTDT